MITSENLQQRDVTFKPGDTVRVHYRLVGGCGTSESVSRARSWDGLSSIYDGPLIAYPITRFGSVEYGY
ncbi:MAG TPA: hypothetical protein VHM69_12980, partial [Rubrobacter sp.]|nr:hypothetical protein [Rubrobacter sp.]